MPCQPLGEIIRLYNIILSVVFNYPPESEIAEPILFKVHSHGQQAAVAAFVLGGCQGRWEN